jgi:hypothetical protein
MTDRVARLAFFASCIAIAVTYGIFAVRWNSFPNPQIALAEATIRDLWINWRNDLGLRPTRHLVDARRPRQGGEEMFRMYRAEAAQPGYTMIAGLSDDPDRSAHAVMLFDGAGREVYRWPVDYAALDPDGPKPFNVMVHGVHPLPDGSLVAGFDQGEAIARIDSCGVPTWIREGTFSHSIEPDDDGGLWSWRGEAMVRLDPGTGAVLREIELRDDVIAADGGRYGEFAIHAAELAEGVQYLGDAFHPNDVEPLRAALAAAFPMFEAGDLLISLRELNLVAVVDPDDGRTKWFRHGPWHRQHDPDWEPDGTISVYDNRMGLGASRILKVDPVTDEITVAYEGSAEHPFYSYRRGKHQFLPNGNLLVTESEAGRVFEAAPDGALVWERDLGWDERRNLIVTSAQHLPADFFEAGALACGASVRAGG